MKSWNVPHSDLKSFCVPFQVELLAGLVPSLDYERTSVVGEFTRQRFDRYRFAFARQQRKEVVRVKRGAYGLASGIEQLQLCEESERLAAVAQCYVDVAVSLFVGTLGITGADLLPVSGRKSLQTLRSWGR